jgi:predicted transcriptional regulator
MAILKAPAKPPKNETLQIRIEEGVRSKLQRYAEFIGSSETYVVSEALKLLFKRDEEFKTWLDQRGHSGEEPHDRSDSSAGVDRTPPKRGVNELLQPTLLRSSD